MLFNCWLFSLSTQVTYENYEAYLPYEGEGTFPLPVLPEVTPEPKPGPVGLALTSLVPAPVPMPVGPVRQAGVQTPDGDGCDKSVRSGC